MAQESTLDASGLLAAVDAKIATLLALRESLKAAISIGALGPVTDVSAYPAVSGGALDSAPIDLPTNPFIGMSVPAAIKLYLTTARRKLTIKQIATALKEGGIESTSSNFETVVTGSLNRLKRAGQVLRFKEGFAWAELYPESMRSRLTKDVKTPSKKKAGRNKKKAKTPEAKAAVQAAVPSVPLRIQQLLRDKKGAELSSQEVATSVGIQSNVAALLLGKLAAQHLVEKTSGGKYRSVMAA